MRGEQTRLPWREQVLMDSLRRIPPKMRMEWLHEHGEGRRTEDGRPRTMSDSGSGLRLVGKWGRGPAAEVTGKDTLVVLTLGSEVALLNFAKPDSPQVLSEIQFPSLTAQSYLEDSLLYTSSNSDLEVWNISSLSNPVQRGVLPAPVGDFWIRDTFLFYIRNDTLHCLSIASSSNLHDLGSCIESGSVTTGSGNTVVVCQSGGFALVDVSNPASPHEIATYPCGNGRSATARGNLVCASYEEAGYPYPVRFITLDISTPSSPRLLAKLDDLGGYDIFLDGPLAFVSGRGIGVENPQPFQILSIADSAHPAFIDSCRTTDRSPYGVWENSTLNRALVADEYDGLAIVDVSNLNNPVLDTWALSAGEARDASVEGTHCYVASGLDGLRILDVADPQMPTCISGLDTAMGDKECDAVTARDSFAYMGWWPNPHFRTVSVADPFRPQIVAGCSLPGFPEDVALRDSFAYVAQDYGFHVINVARPRAPALVGTCALPDMMNHYGMDVTNRLAFVANGVSGLQIVSVAQPDSPAIVGALTPPNGACGVAVIDTFAYVASGNLYIVSVASPSSPYLIDSMALPKFGATLAVCDSLLFVGSWDPWSWGRYTNDVHLFDIGNPTMPVSVGSLLVPNTVDKLAWADPYLYVACGDAGVLIAETAAVGVKEPERVSGPRSELRVTPNPAGEIVRVQFGEPTCINSRLSIYDAAGRQVLVKNIRKEVSSTELGLAGLRPGLYFVRVETKTGVLVSKVIKR